MLHNDFCSRFSLSIATIYLNLAWRKLSYVDRRHVNLAITHAIFELSTTFLLWLLFHHPTQNSSKQKKHNFCRSEQWLTPVQSAKISKYKSVHIPKFWFWYQPLGSFAPYQIHNIEQYLFHTSTYWKEKNANFSRIKAKPKILVSRNVKHRHR